MERFKAPTTFLQIQLWQDCRNGCLFCSEKQYPSDKIQDIQFAMDKLNSEEVLEFDEIGLIGGEFFDNQLDKPEVLERFYELWYKIVHMHFKKIYIATSLIFDMDKYFIPFLKEIRNWGCADKFLICTSYDTKWRFNKKGKEELWHENMIKLQEEFPDFKTHIEIILTGDFIDKVLEGKFNISAFSKCYNSRVDYIEPTSGLHYKTKQDLQKVCPNFFPTKAKFIEFIKKECIEKKTVDIRCLISYQVRASRVYHKDQGRFVCYYDRRHPDFKVQSLDKEYVCDVGMIDTDECMEHICTSICEMLPDDLYSNIDFN